ncbi:MAG: Na+/H+ antiporter NhaA [Candidatus Andersenbacteria bacterium]
MENSLCLVIGAIVALIWANVDHESYEHLVHYELFGKTVHFWINDVAMSMFFMLAGKEVFEAMLPGGSLSSFKKAATPLLATVGGMFVPAGIYAGCCMAYGMPELLKGWAIPCATDIAFSYMIARFIFGVNHAAIPFLLLVAIADDAGGLGILAVFYPQGDINLLWFFGLVVLALILSFGLRYSGVRNFWTYLVGPGVLSWVGFYIGGLHPALGLVPLVATMPHERDDLGIFSDREGARGDTLNMMEHWWKHKVEIILGLFALVNAGVVFSSVNETTWFVVFSLIVGKPLGIVACTLLATKLCGLAMPEGMTVRDLVIVGMVAGIGFTVSLFVSVCAFPGGGSVQDAAKMGALLSIGSAGVAVLASMLLRVGRYGEVSESSLGVREAVKA